MTRANQRRTPVWLVLCSTALIGFATALQSQEASPLQTPAAQLVRETVAQEVAANNEAGVRHLFRSRRQTPKGSQTRIYVETEEAMAGMLVAINDQPLNAEQQQAELGHLDWLNDNPDQVRKKHAREKDDAERTMRIVRALPDAFLYQYDGTEMGQPGLGKAGEPLLRLKFTPNPSYAPPSRVEQVLQGMQGYLLIDSSAHRIAKIDGALFRDVTFGWGIIGHLDKGGIFTVQQADVGDGSWNITRTNLKITGKILLFKSISMNTDERYSDFEKVAGNITFAKGVELLKSERERLAPAHSSEPPSTSKDSH
jgi:hypothetical protein